MKYCDNKSNNRYSWSLKGEIEVPGDKSMTHRAIMLSSLAKGKSIIEQPLLGEDCLRTIEILNS